MEYFDLVRDRVSPHLTIHRRSRVRGIRGENERTTRGKSDILDRYSSFKSIEPTIDFFQDFDELIHII
jgi:hypothetical protein